jgi:hypothetical protein
LAESTLDTPSTVKPGVAPELSGIWKWPTKVPRTALSLLVASSATLK